MHFGTMVKLADMATGFPHVLGKKGRTDIEVEKPKSDARHLQK
jgi:hypothetical protein